LRSLNILTLFPEFFTGPFTTGLMGKFIEKGSVRFNIVDIRTYSEDNFNRCDDYPYGGGSGMVLKPEPLFRALDALENRGTVMLTSPSGVPLTQQRVKEFSDLEDITIICGHYEGVDQRVVDTYVDHEVSIGDYVLSGGEFAALIITDTLVRYLPGFMSNPESLVEETFEESLLEYPHYTRPDEYRGLQVPPVLLSGNHAKIAEWRLQNRLEKTRRVRPDLYNRYQIIKEKQR
jgi:tRNA (guanine37-N1)-methyltransferase